MEWQQFSVFSRKNIYYLCFVNIFSKRLFFHQTNVLILNIRNYSITFTKKTYLYLVLKTFSLFSGKLKFSFLTYEIATILCMNVCPMKTNSSSASMSHFSLIAIIWQETIGQDEPTLLIAWKVKIIIFSKCFCEFNLYEMFRFHEKKP